MISIRFFTFSKKVNSTARPDLTSATTFNCTLKSTCSILSPEITLDTGSANAPRFNYCFIEEFDRYYFVSNWTWANGLWSASLTVDALASWKNTIGASTQYILRSASAYNGEIIDNLYPVKTRPKMVYRNIDLFNATSLDTGCFVIGVINQDTNAATLTVGTVSYYVMYSEQLRYLKQKLLDTSIWDSVIKDYANPLHFITSVNWFPISITTVSSPHVLKCGNIELTGVYAWDIASSTMELSKNINLPLHPEIDRGVYTLNAPFSEYVIYNECLGSIPIDFSADTPTIDSQGSLTRKGLHLKARIDIATGKCNLRITMTNSQAEEVENVITESTGNIAAPIQLAQITSWSAADLGNAIMTGAGAIGSFAVGNVAGAIAGGTGFIGNALEGSKANMITTGSNGSLNTMKVPTVLKCTFHIPVDENVAHRGRPLCSDRLISSLSGYILCSDVELAIAGTSEETDTIKSYMEGGFYYE